MKPKKAIKKILKENNITMNKLARALETTHQNVEFRLSDRCKTDLSTTALIEMANYLDYDVVLLPKSKNGGGGIIIDGKDEQ